MDTYPLELIEAIAARHGLTGTPALLPRTGLVNEAWRIGDHVLRIVRHPDGDTEAAREVQAARLVEAAGIRTPRLVASDLTSTVAPRPYTIYRFVDGVLLGALDPAPSLDATCHDVGGELARIARIAVAAGGAITVRDPFDPRRSIQRTVDARKMSAAEAAEVARWLDALEPRLGAPEHTVFLHRDIHPWNLLVDPDTGALAALIDWGDASIGDPALDFMAMPVPTLPAMLDGYCAAGGRLDPGFTARLVVAGIALAAWELRELDPAVFDRRWWRMPPGGWDEHRAQVAAVFPELAG